jgi:dihydroxyacetone kinase phosphotransfer subunit
MIHLVIVSHSRQIARGVAELAQQMAPPTLCISAVGGLDEGSGPPILGVDAVQVFEAIDQVDAPDGTLILVDLGSAVLCAETALDLLAPEQRSRCRISNAPLVEGAVVAALEAGLNRSLEDVNRAAEAACAVTKVWDDTPSPASQEGDQSG